MVASYFGDTWLSSLGEPGALGQGPLPSGGTHPRALPTHSWVAVRDLKLSYHKPEAISLSTYSYYGRLIEVRSQKPYH